MIRYFKRISSSISRLNLPVNNELKILQICKVNNLLKRYITSTSDGFYKDVDYDKVTKGDSDLLKKLKVIMLEVEVLRQEGSKVPKVMTTERWIEILHAKTKNQRLKHLAFWWVNEKKKENDKEKKESKRLARENSAPDFRKDNGHIFYGFGGSTIFIRIYESTIDRWKNWKALQAMMFNQTLIIDCGYEDHMTPLELSLCSKQLLYSFSENRSHSEPFNLFFSDVRRDGKLLTRLHKLLPTLYDADFPFTFSNKSYLDLYPKEKLVYLTPHCREELKEYDDDDIYIIGGMVDKVNCEPLSLGKAKAQGIRMAKFPLERYLEWAVGTKSLTINQCLSIMLDLKVTNDWDKALQHIPRRKIRQEEENKIRNKTYDKSIWKQKREQISSFRKAYNKRRI